MCFLCLCCVLVTANDTKHCENEPTKQKERSVHCNLFLAFKHEETASLPQTPNKNGCQKLKIKRKEEKENGKTKITIRRFYRNGFYGTQEQQYLKAQVREELKEQGFIIDSSFEGDFKTWIGVYARPKDKPTYLDPQNDKEAEEQEQYSINGFKQDFSEWFEWEIKNLKIKEI